MRDEYDVSEAERGRFFRPEAALVPPVHLEADVLAFPAVRAEARGVSLNEPVDAPLRKDIELIAAAEWPARCCDSPPCKILPFAVKWIKSAGVTERGGPSHPNRTAGVAKWRR